MQSTLSSVQIELFLNTSGRVYDGSKHKDSFLTDRPFNDSNYKLSPWLFSYVFEAESGRLYCRLSHRMTNDRCFGWDFEGNILSNKDLEMYFKDTSSAGLQIIKKASNPDDSR